MAWSSTDQNPTTAPAAGGYSAQIGTSGYYANPVYTPTSGTTAAAAPGATQAGGQSYSERVGVNTPAADQPATSGALAASAAPRKVPANMSAYTNPYSTKGRALPSNQGVAIQTEAARLGIEPSDLAAVIGYETIGTFDPGIVGGKKNRYQGLIQMGPSERKAYGWRDGMSFEEQLHGPVHNYLVDRGVRPGHGIAEIYSIVNAGSLRNGQPRWNASDRPGQNVRTHSANISRTYDPRYAYLDPGAATEQGEYPETMFADAGQDTLAGGNVPSPRMRPLRSDTSMAYAPAPEAMEESPFNAVMGADRRPQPATPRMRPQRDTLTAQPAQAAQPQGGAYVVKRGDNLSKIAARELGDPNRWREIAAANRIRDPNVIQPGQRLVIPGATQAAPARQPANVPQPRMRPSREVAMPTPRPRPERGANVPTPRLRPSGEAPAAGFDTRRLDDAATPRQQSPTRITGEAEIRQSVDAYRQDAIRKGAPPGPGLERAVQTYEQSLRRQAGVKPAMDAADIGRSVSEFRADLLRRGVPAGPRLDAAVNNYARRLQEQAGGGVPMSRAEPAGPGMDTAGLIREPTAEERALQGGARMRLPTGTQPMDPQVAAQIARTPAVITEIAPPTYTAPNGARVWALR